MIRVLKITALVSVVVLLNAVTTLLFVQRAAPASAGPNCVNGDVNGDFVVDITDPIHLLGYIFEGTPVPVACAQNPSGVTAADLDFITGKYQGIPAEFQITFNADPNTSAPITVPSGQKLVVTSYHIADRIVVSTPGSMNSQFQSSPYFIGRNFDANLLPLGTDIGSVEALFEDPFVEAAGIVPSSPYLGSYQIPSYLDTFTGGRVYTPESKPRRDMFLVFNPGDQLTVHRPNNSPIISITLNGFWLNAN